MEFSHAVRTNYSLSGGMVLIFIMAAVFWSALLCYSEDGCAGLDISLKPKHVNSGNAPSFHELQGC